MPFAMYFARDTGCFLGHYRMNRRLVVPHAPLLEVATCDIQASHLSHYQVAYGPTSHRERGDRQPNHIHPPTHPPTYPSIHLPNLNLHHPCNPTHPANHGDEAAAAVALHGAPSTALLAAVRPRRQLPELRETRPCENVKPRTRQAQNRQDNARALANCNGAWIVR